MMRTGTLLMCLLVLPAAARAQEFRERLVLNDRVALLVPTGFTLMSDEVRRVKYPNNNRPDVVFTNEATTVNVALRHTPEALPPEALPQAFAAIQDAFRNLYPSAAWFRQELVTINGRPWFIIDLRTPAIDTEVRNIISGTSLDGRLLIVSFNATLELESAWLSTGNRIIQSLVVK